MGTHFPIDILYAAAPPGTSEIPAEGLPLGYGDLMGKRNRPPRILVHADPGDCRQAYCDACGEPADTVALFRIDASAFPPEAFDDFRDDRDGAHYSINGLHTWLLQPVPASHLTLMLGDLPDGDDIEEAARWRESWRS